MGSRVYRVPWWQFDEMPYGMQIQSPFVYASVGGIMVSIAAFQAVDPGSIPGRRKFFFFSSQDLNPGCWEQVHPFQGYFHI